ncbi:MAG: hypothetical protein KC592_20510 [Nitrospira sp.]|nr:hypothetical protein [Nitrospira sp.]
MLLRASLLAPLLIDSTFGANIQRTLTLLATSTPEKRNRVRILFNGQSVTRNPWWEDVTPCYSEKNVDKSTHPLVLGEMVVLQSRRLQVWIGSRLNPDGKYQRMMIAVRIYHLFR